MIGINHIGENVLDLECRVLNLNGAELKKSGHGDVLVFPGTNKNLEFVVYDPTEKKYYQGKIDPNSKFVVNGDSLIADKKFDQTGDLEEIDKNTYDNSSGIKLKVTEKSPGGGAINCGVGVQVFLEHLGINDIANRIVVPNGDKDIEQFLLNNYNISEYKPQGWNKDAGKNIIFTLEGGKSFTLRSPYEFPYKNRGNYDISFIQPGDFVVINTIKDQRYISGLLAEIKTKCQINKILIASDSSMKAMGTDYVKKLLKDCSVIISNDSELDMLVNKKNRELGKVNLHLLVKSMEKIRRDNQIIYTTLGKCGIAVYDGNNTYKQGTSITQSEVKNTNGCGDATAAIIVLYTVLGNDHLSTILTLIDANIAGQINAKNPTASSKSMATKERIEQFKRNYILSPIDRI